MAYSKDYRQMILDKLDEGYSYRELAEEYQISTTTIQRWKKNIERKAYVYTVYKVDSDRLKADVELYPDAYQIERASQIERARRLNCSQRSISRALKRLGITQKKDTASS